MERVTRVDYAQVIAGELGVKPRQVEQAIRLLDEGNTIPFVARYRKEATGELDEEQLRQIQARLTYLRNLATRKNEVLHSLAEMEKLTPELQAAIAEAVTLQAVEDLYRPFRPKRKTRATVAKERGLEPLAKRLAEDASEDGNPLVWAEDFVDPERGVASAEAALAGAMDILAEAITDEPEIRQAARTFLWKEGVLRAELKDADAEQAREFTMYADYREPVNKIPPHRILAINRGEKLNVLKVGLEFDEERLIRMVSERSIRYPRSCAVTYLQQAIADGVKRLLLPAVGREIRAELMKEGERQAIKIFGVNLRHLLLQPPVKGRRVLGIDPGFRTGCKVAVVDETGKLLTMATIYPHPPQNRREEALQILEGLVKTENVDLLAIGNGTASRETELLVAELLQKMGRNRVEYCIVSEAGASVYSASPLAREELPKLDVAMRGAVSIARRLQDPLAELVKIEPRSIGVGQYQHDVDEKELEAALAAVVESCVNFVGVDLNTASPALLSYVAGIGPALAGKIVAHREQNGRFKQRKDLLAVIGLGQKTFTQAAGFIRVPESANPLDNTPVHPESYAIAEKLLAKLGFSLADLQDKSELQRLRASLRGLALTEFASELGVGLPTLQDIADALARPGRDPRESLPPPIFRRDVLKMEDLREGMVLQGTVRNVVDFGAFVDIGVKQDGLVHISELSEAYVRHPADKVAVGDVVRVRVLGVDHQRQRISLSMKGVAGD